MTLLSGVGIIMWPIAKYVGGQLYGFGGYYAVYGTALSFTFLGTIYIYVIPESVIKRVKIKDASIDQLKCKNGQPSSRRTHRKHIDLQECRTVFGKAKHVFYIGNQTILESYR